jgi:class 3 adenylate cyclase
VRCPSCESDNPEGARFCGECGAALEEKVSCSSCGAENAAAQKFCHSCGQSLREPEPPGRAATLDRPRPEPGEALVRDPRSYTPQHLADKIIGARGDLEGERKQVTVLFADVMGSMDLAERTDPEAWRRIMERFFAILCDGVHRFEGTVDKFTGDGIMALFGAPIAHEDHAQRACFAALSLGDELGAYATELRREQGINLSVRIGINSGEVVVGAIGDDLSLEYTAIGHTVGLAQRMESLAEPGKAYVTDNTARLVAGYVDLRDLGEFDVKGASGRMRVHEVAGAGAARSRLDISRARGFTRFVGRDDELAALEAALESARSGNGTVVGVVGEPGVGKSRLCHEFAERCRREGTPSTRRRGRRTRRRFPSYRCSRCSAATSAWASTTPISRLARRSPGDCCCSTRRSPRTCRWFSTSWRFPTQRAPPHGWTPMPGSVPCSAWSSAWFTPRAAASLP